MKKKSRSAEQFDGVHRRLSRLLPDDNYQTRDDSNGKRFLEGVWEPRTGVSRPTSAVEDGTASAIVGLHDHLGPNYAASLVVMQSNGKMSGGQMPTPQWM